MAADKTLGHKPGFEIIAPIPVYYLAGHSIELALKAYLLHRGESLRDLKRHGHDLHKCFRKAKELGLLEIVSFDDNELAAFEHMNILYSTKQFEYIVTGAKRFPIFGYVQAMGRKLLDAICPTVGYAR